MNGRLYRTEDEKDLIRLAEASMPGWVKLKHLYGSGYAQSEKLKGDGEIIVVERGDGLVAGCGTCSTRMVYLDGRPSKIGYLSGLKSFADRRGGFGFYRGLLMLAELERSNPHEFTFMTVLKNNSRAHTLLLSGRHGLPRCRSLGEIVTYALSALPERDCQKASFDELKEFYSRHSPRKQLFPLFGEDFFPPGISADDFFVIRKSGRIVAAGALWSHGKRRKIVVDGYNSLMRVARPAVNALSSLLNMPRLPLVGEEFRCTYLAYALVENDSLDLFSELMDAARRNCNGSNLVLSLHSLDPLCKALSLLRAWRYKSEMIEAAFGGRGFGFNGVPHLEAGAL